MNRRVQNDQFSLYQTYNLIHLLLLSWQIPRVILNSLMNFRLPDGWRALAANSTASLNND